MNCPGGAPETGHGHGNARAAGHRRIAKDLFCTDDPRRIRALQILGLLKKNPKDTGIIG